MTCHISKFFYFSAILSVIFLVCPASPAQEEVDLALTSQASRYQVRGGEIFTINSKVTNLSAETATKVYLTINHHGSVTFASATASQGECKIYEDVKKTICDVGDIKNGDAVDVSLEMKVVGFDDISEPVRSSNFILAPFGNGEAPSDRPGRVMEIKIHLNASSIEPDTDGKNNNVDLQLWALPNKNIPPRIEILSPKTEKMIKKSIDKTLDIPVTFKAYDPDGKLTDVVVNDTTAAMKTVSEKRFRSVYENGEYKIYAGDKEVSEQDLNDYTAELNRKAITKVQPDSSGAYTFLWKNLQYGKNDLHIQAVDNGGGYGFATVTIEVISDAVVEFTPAQKIRIYPPGSTINIEVASRIGPGSNPELKLTCPNNSFDPPFQPMKQIFKQGNNYKHLFLWKDVQEGVYNLNAFLFENGQQTLVVEGPRIIVTLPRVFKITSLKNGQVFAEGDPIPISFEVKDINGKPTSDEFNLLVDGMYHSEVYNSLRQSLEQPDPEKPPVLKTITDLSIYQITDLPKGVHTIQIIAKEDMNSSDPMILGRSEIIKITVR